MRETVGSLRMYFILVGLFSLVFSWARLGITPWDGVSGWVQTATYILTWGTLLLALAYLGVGLKLKQLLVSLPQIPLRLALVAIILSLLSLNILGILLNVYIFYQLKRMAREAEPELEGQVLR